MGFLYKIEGPIALHYDLQELPRLRKPGLELLMYYKQGELKAKRAVGS